MRIIYKTKENTLTIVCPSSEWAGTMQELAQKVVPSGLKYKIVEDSVIPTDQTFSDACGEVLAFFNKNGSLVDDGDERYNYVYDFNEFYGDTALAGDGVILPSLEPSVFELKFPNKDIRGKVL